jgi:hypothetical protein
MAAPQTPNQNTYGTISSRLSQPGPCEPPPPPPPILVDAENGPSLNPNLKPIIDKILACSVTEPHPHLIDEGCYCLNMSTRRTLVACTAIVLLTAIGSVSVSADESVPSQSSTTTVLEQFDEESVIVWSQIDDNMIEVSLSD